MRRILVTNDDGIDAPGIHVLASWAKRFGEVSVSAPKKGQSSKSHSIQLGVPFEVKRVDSFDGIDAISVDSTPADCVRFAILGLGNQYDIILSGINNGYNVGTDILYSGTVAAVFEAAVLGHRAVAFSADFDTSSLVADQLDKVADYFEQHDLMSYSDLYNVNIPTESHGFLITRQGGVFYSDKYVKGSDGLYTAVGFCAHNDKKDLRLDTDAVTNGFISVSPLTMTRTDTELCTKLASTINPK